MRTTILISMVTAALLGVTSCKSSERQREMFDKTSETITQPSDMTMKYRELDQEKVGTMDEVQDDLAEARADFSDAMHARIATIDAKLDELGNRTDDAAHETAAKLRLERDKLSGELDALGTRVEQNWDAVKNDIEARIDALEKEIDDAG